MLFNIKQKQINIFFIFLLIITLIFYLLTNLYIKNMCFANSLSNETKSFFLLESTNNTTLYKFNEKERLPMASTTKIITTITILENIDNINKQITIPHEATIVEGSSIYLMENEQLSIIDLLYGLMLRSGNDAAVALALEVGNGSLKNFADKMNAIATKCGAYDTHFVTPHGLDDPEHYTTAYDLAKITSYALKNPIFKKIVSTKQYIIEGTEHNKKRILNNKNKLLKTLDGCIGVKTGYTKKSGRCLVSACERNGMQVVCVVLNCGPMFEVSEKLINKAFEEYELYNILPSYKFAKDIKIENGDNSNLRIYNKNGFSVVTKKQDKDRYSVKYQYNDNIKAPIQKDEKLGEVMVYFDNDLIFSENLCSIEKVDEIGQKDKIKSILDKW